MVLEQKLQTKNEVLSELMEEHLKLKKLWGSLNGLWTEPDIRDGIIDFIVLWFKKAEIKALRLVDWNGNVP